MPKGFPRIARIFEGSGRIDFHLPMIGTSTSHPQTGKRAAARVATLTHVRVLGVDLGSKRIGLAISDEAAEIAFPAGILDSRGRKRDIRALRELITEKHIGRAVVGLPIHMDGRRGPEAEKAIRFATDLSEATGIPVDTLDERWTSQEAERLLKNVPKKRGPGRREKGIVDEMAASIILRTYLAIRTVGGTDRNDGERSQP
jgi:putative Holliday junction resolvase